MALRSSAARRSAVIDEQIRKLAGCDQRLSQIAADVARLLDVLSSLQADADRLRARVSERDALLAETTLELSSLESERAAARRDAEDASGALADAQRALLESHGRADALERELHGVRDAVGRQDRRLAELGADLSRVRDALASREAEAATATNAPVPHSEERSERPTLHVVGPPVEPSAEVTGHVLFVGSPDGYLLAFGAGPSPGAGDLVELGGQSFVVTRVGPSPLAADHRPCAFLQVDPRRG